MRYYISLLAIVAFAAGYASAQNWNETICYDGKMWDDCGQQCNHTCSDPQDWCQDNWCGEGRCQCPGDMLWDERMYMCVDKYNCSGTQNSSTSCSNCYNGACDVYGNCYGNCSQGYYGYGCANKCSEYCARGVCDMHGVCTYNCTYGHYGPNWGCTSTCSRGCDYGKCDGLNGACYECMEGYHGLFCDQVCNFGCTNKMESCSSDGPCVSHEECDTKYLYDGCDMCNECEFEWKCEGMDCVLPSGQLPLRAAGVITVAATALLACLVI